MMMPSLQLRPIQAEDRDFLYQVYASTREEELAVTGWDAAQKQAFLTQQFEAQRQHYQAYYTGARFDLILCNEEPIGRLYVARWRQEIRIIDIALLPAHRNRGVGEKLVRELLAEAVATGKRLSIHVERFNRALRFYERLGFVQVADKGVYLLLEATGL